jgi:hypothetical protein
MATSSAANRPRRVHRKSAIPGILGQAMIAEISRKTAGISEMVLHETLLQISNSKFQITARR